MNRETILGLTKMEKAAFFILPMLIGAVLGWFIPNIADLLLKSPIIPFEKLVVYIANTDNFWISVIAMVLGIIIGLIFTGIVFHETLNIKITDNELSFQIKDQKMTISKKDVSAIFLENKSLIVLGLTSKELYREHTDINISKAQEAFTSHGYPWKMKDPYTAEYRKWELDDANFPKEITNILYARRIALREDNKKDAKHLREDLNELGVVVRDRDGQQHVRRVN